MKAKKRKKRVSGLSYSRLPAQDKKETEKLIRSANAEEKERVWQKITKRLEEENA